MRQFLTLIITVIITTHSSFSQKNTSINPYSDYTYYDEKSQEITADEFLKKSNEKGYFILTHDSLKIKKLTERSKKGVLDDRKELIKHLENLTSKIIDSTKPIIIIYHPGKDPCNSSGSADYATMKDWYNELEKGTNRIAGVKPIYISKKADDLGVRDLVVTWYEDKDQVIEKLFFKYHYPCSSYVIISKNSQFHSQFGEFGKLSVWNVLKTMKRK